MNLYSRRSFQASLLLFLAVTVVLTTAIVAQRRKAHKLRATALLELTTDSSGKNQAQLIPIAILDEGSFHDAGIYKVAPRPFALQEGVVYEAQQTGTVLGYFTVRGAFKRGTWIGQGEWQPALPAKPSATPGPTPTPDDRPVLRRPGSAAAATPTPAPAVAASPSPAPAVAQPTPLPDPDRPVLKRQGATDHAGSTSTKAVAPAAIEAPGATAAQATPAATLTPGTHILVAISDEQPLDARSYEFPWKPGEKTTVETKMRKLALAQLPRETPPLTENALKNVTVRGFDLDMTNDAALVLTAEVPGTSSVPGKAVTRYITVIARMDFDGNPQRLAASVADSSRLDVAPRLELVDAADVDGDGAAELIFRQYDFDQKSYIIYSVGRSSVSKVFEGASAPLK